MVTELHYLRRPICACHWAARSRRAVGATDSSRSGYCTGLWIYIPCARGMGMWSFRQRCLPHGFLIFGKHWKTNSANHFLTSYLLSRIGRRREGFWGLSAMCFHQTKDEPACYMAWESKMKGG